MPIIDVQMRLKELGRIRIGQKGTKGQPQKLDRFRFTSADKALVERVAALYGGTVTPWTAPDGREQSEVVTDATRIPVLLPPQPVTQWMELWSGGGCQRRCDGQTETLTDSPCICKAADAEVVCKPTTRLSVVLRDVPGLGVWRLETHGWNAAQELPGAAAFAAQAGGMIPAHLTLEERVSKADGQTRRFMVPGLDVEVTPAELLAFHAPAAVEAAPVAAIGSRDFLAEVAAASSRDEVTAAWRAAGSPQSGPLVDACKARTAELAGDGPAGDADFDGLWLQIVAAAPEDWTTDRLEEEFAAACGGTMPGSASAAQLETFLRLLRAAS